VAIGVGGKWSARGRKLSGQVGSELFIGAHACLRLQLRRQNKFHRNWRGHKRVGPDMAEVELEPEAGASESWLRLAIDNGAGRQTGRRELRIFKWHLGRPVERAQASARSHPRQWPLSANPVGAACLAVGVSMMAAFD